MHFEEKGTLPIGVVHEGNVCREFRIRPLKMKAMNEFMKTDAFKECADDDERLGLALLGLRIRIDGFPKEQQTLAFMEDLWNDDFLEIMAASGRLEEKLATFRGTETEADGAGAVEAEPAVEGGEPVVEESGEGGGVVECVDSHSGPVNGYGMVGESGDPYP